MREFDETAAQVAKLLLEIKAVKLQPNQPFTWTSGWKSPIYCDNRLTLSFPRIRTYLRQRLASLIVDKFGDFEDVVGIATASMPQGVLVAEELDKPFLYVRSQAKGHGMKNQIEGWVVPGHSVVVVEDLISTGKSSLKAVEALREADLTVKGVVSIFNYEFPEAEQAFKDANVPFYSLSSYSALLQKALEEQYINDEDMETLQAWRENPSAWMQEITQEELGQDLDQSSPDSEASSLDEAQEAPEQNS